jgi:5'-methylthioadenosine phosphorylase
MLQAKIGVIGGTGLYQIEGMANIREISLDTPFGKPSDSLITGELNGMGIAFLPRHGRGHSILPGEIPYRANIYALKSMGVEHILAVNSCGSFKEEIRPGDLLIPDQVIDRTQGRITTFFGDGVVAHVSIANPFCPELNGILISSAREAGTVIHPQGTYICIEGPAFSTSAESRLYKSWGADVIGMTIFPEAKLAREAEICYTSICCVTDYDSWKEKGEPVTADVIISILRRNVDISKKIIKLALGKMPTIRGCECALSLKSAIVSIPAAMTNEQKQKFDLLIGKYIEKK